MLSHATSSVRRTTQVAGKAFCSVDGITIVKRIGQGNQSVLQFSHVKNSDKSVVVYVHLLKSVSDVTGTSFSALSTIKAFARIHGAEELFLQFQPANQRLFELVSQKYTYLGKRHYVNPELGLNLPEQPVFQIPIKRTAPQ